MEENPPRFREGDRRRRRRRRRPLTPEDGGRDTAVKCSGESCRSCTGGVIADCVAVCCCPCAVPSLLVLTLVKVPWKLGRRCLGRRKMKGRGRESARNCRKIERSDSVITERDGKSRTPVNFEVGLSAISSDAPKNEKFDESERAWSELFVQDGHLGFGRVSSSGETISEKS